MSVTTRRTEQRTEYDIEVVNLFELDPEGVEARCFYCAKIVFHPAVYWHGYGTNIYLHRECALGLALHLRSDAAKCKAPATMNGEAV